MPDRDLLAMALQEARRVADPLADAAVSPDAMRRLFAELGWDLDAVGADLSALTTTAAAVLKAVDDVADAADDLPEAFDKIPGAIATVGEAVSQLARLPEAVEEALQSLAVAASAIPAPETMARELLDLLAIRYLQVHRPKALAVLVLLGLIDDPARAPDTPQLTRPDGTVLRRPVPRPRLALGTLPELISDPAGTLRQHWAPGPGALLGTQQAADLFADLLFPRLADAARSLGADAMYGTKAVHGVEFGSFGNPRARHALTLRGTVALPEGTGPDPDLLSDGPRVAAAAEVGATLLLSGADAAGLGLVVLPYGAVQVNAALAGWDLTLDAKTGNDPVTSRPAGFAITQAGIISPAAPTVAVDLTLERVRAGGAPAVVLGSDTTRLEIGALTISAGGEFGATAADPRAAVKLDAARIVVQPGDGDGFLRSVLPAKGIEVPFDLGIGWSRSRGLVITGGASLEVDIPIDLDLGFLRVPILSLAVVAGDGGLALSAAASADVRLGPAAGTIERIGVRLAFARPEPGDAGNAGPIEVALSFEPPRGIAARLDTGPVKGAGYLFADRDKGEYAGVLALTIGPVSVTAVGLLSTRLPGGVGGFSLVVIISAQFPPVQLGFGFVLTGVGGIVGINRAMDLESLGAAVRSGQAENLLFPRDPVANARQVVASVGAVFPATAGQFVIGPMVKLGWGTPPVLDASLAIVIQFPSLAIALIGRIQLALPREEAAIVLLRVSFTGAFDSGKRQITLDGTLEGSRVAMFPIGGDFAMRLRFGDDPMFALSAGGFHPEFATPAGFPALRRLSISLAAGDNPRLRLEAYLAVTPATVQFGARAELYAAADLGFVGFFDLDAALGFDALIRFDPFGIVTRLHAHVLLRRNGSAFAGVELDLSLRGPEPWEAEGVVTVHFLGTHRLRARIVIGEGRALPPVVEIDVEALVRTALGEPGNWQARPPATDIGVRLLNADRTAALVAHPLGQLGVQQHVAPLDLKLDKVGEAVVRGADEIRVTGVRLGGALLGAGALEATRAAFARPQFQQLTDGERLSGPAFEQLPNGRTLADEDVTVIGPVVLDTAYEDLVVDKPDAPPASAGASAVTALDWAVLGGVAARGREARRRRFAGPSSQIEVSDPGWVVVAAGAGAGVERTVHATAFEATAAARAAGNTGLVVPQAEAVA